MAIDILHFLHSYSLLNVSLLGYSMRVLTPVQISPDTHLTGSKSSAAKSLWPELPAHAAEHLMVADIRRRAQGYIDAMNMIEKSGVNSRRESQDFLAPCEPVGHHLH